MIDTSLLEVAIHVQGPTWLQMFRSGVEPRRSGNGYPSAAPAAEVIGLRDGQIVLSAYTPEHWARLCAALGRPELVTDPRFASNDARVEHRRQMQAALTAALGSRTVAEAVEFLNCQGVVCGAVRTHAQVVDGPDAGRLASFRTTEPTALPSYRYPSPPFRIRDVPAARSSSAPGIGEHTRQVLGRLGYSEAEVDKLVSDGVVKDGGPSGAEAL